MKADVLLQHARMGDTYSGKIMVQVHPTRGFLYKFEFQDYPFSRMMSRLARVVQEYEDATVLFNRTDLNTTHVLDGETVALLRVDPARVIRAMSIEPVTVMIRDRDLPRPIVGSLRVGYDTLAASFGDTLYCSVRDDGRVECPGCGRWSEPIASGLVCRNKPCEVVLCGAQVDSRWFSVATVDVLALQRSKYYFPRDWNSKRGWISHIDLTDNYNTFQKERTQCYRTDQMA